MTNTSKRLGSSFESRLDQKDLRETAQRRWPRLAHSLRSKPGCPALRLARQAPCRAMVSRSGRMARMGARPAARRRQRPDRLRRPAGRLSQLAKGHARRAGRRRAPRDSGGIGRHRHSDRRGGLHRARPRAESAGAARRQAARRPDGSPRRPDAVRRQPLRPARLREGGLSKVARIRSAGLRTRRPDGHASRSPKRKFDAVDMTRAYPLAVLPLLATRAALAGSVPAPLVGAG